MNTIQKDKVKPKAEMSVLFVEEFIDGHSDLKQALLSLDYQISKHISSTDNLLAKCEKYNSDILIIRTKAPTSKTIKELAAIKQFSPLPIIIFAEQDTPSLIQRATKAGVNAYVVNETQSPQLNGIITLACERFNEIQLLRNELEQAKAQLQNRKLIERAKGFIMQQKKISEQEAFSMLRKMSMNNGQSLDIVSKNVIEVYELLGPSNY